MTKRRLIILHSLFFHPEPLHPSPLPFRRSSNRVFFFIPLLLLIHLSHPFVPFFRLHFALSLSLSFRLFLFLFFFSPPSFFREERGRVASCHGNSKLLRATCLLVCRARVKERRRGVSLPPCFSHPPQNLRETPQKRQLIVMIRNVRLPQSTADTAPLFRN